MGDHIDNRKNSSKRRHKKAFKEGLDPVTRGRRVTFKNYLREVEEELLEADLEEKNEDTQDDDQA